MKSVREYIDLVEGEKLARDQLEVQLAEQTAATGPTPEAAKALAKADKTQKQWVNGERYVYSDTDAGPQWVLDYSQVPGREVGSTGLSGLFTSGVTKRRGETGFTGAQSAATVGQVGKTGQAAQPAAKTAGAVNPNVQAYQKELVAAGLNVGATGADGRWGKNTAAAAADPKAAEINAKYADKIPQLKNIQTAQPTTPPTTQAAQPTAQPAAPAGWTPTPEQAKWLGGADQQDPNILSRMPGQKPPVTHFKDPADQALAKQLGFPAAPSKWKVNDTPSTADELKAAQTLAQQPAPQPAAQPTKESVSYGEDQSLARIVSLVNYK